MLQSLPDAELRALADAAAVIAETMRVLARSETDIVAEVLATSPTFYEWDHLPSDDVFDHDAGSQYYYHAHPKSENGLGIHDTEHGHFHTFLREPTTPGAPRSPESHLIAIAMNAAGVPIALFTVNRWVTGEAWRPAPDLANALPQFQIDHVRPSWPLNLWITSMLVLFRPQIITLMQQRDDAIAAASAAGRALEEVFEDRSLDVLSHLHIDLVAHIDAVLGEVARRASGT